MKRHGLRAIILHCKEEAVVRVHLRDEGMLPLALQPARPRAIEVGHQASILPRDSKLARLRAMLQNVLPFVARRFRCCQRQVRPFDAERRARQRLLEVVCLSP